MRTSYQVGRPWMLDGKILRGETGTPMRRMERANNSLAEAEPDPLTLANLTTKLLTASILFTFIVLPPSGRPALRFTATRSRRRHFEQEFLHVPRAGRAALCAQSAMQADVFVLHHHAASLERVGDIEVLGEIQRRGIEPRAHVFFLAVDGDR